MLGTDFDVALARQSKAKAALHSYMVRLSLDMLSACDCKNSRQGEVVPKNCC